MALKKANTAPSFEQEPTTDSEAHVAQDSQATQVAQQVVENTAETEAPSTQSTTEVDADAAAKVTATPAIAKAATTSTAVAVADAASKAKQFQREVEAMKGASDFSYGNYRVFKGNNGEILESGGDEDSLGRWAKVRLLSWDDHYEVSPGEQAQNTKEFVAYSKDGKTIDSVIGEDQKAWVGRSVDEYIKHLKEVEEFPNTKCRRFVDTAVALLGTDSSDGPIGSVIQVTLSESSIPAFSRYQQELQDKARCVAMGLPGFNLPEDPFTFFFLREVATKGNNKWTKLKIVATLPAKI